MRRQEHPRIAMNSPIHFGRIDRLILPISVVQDRHQKLQLLYAANR